MNIFLSTYMVIRGRRAIRRDGKKIEVNMLSYSLYPYKTASGPFPGGGLGGSDADEPPYTAQKVHFFTFEHC